MTKARDLANSAAAFAAVSATELGFVDGVTSAIQTQMDAKAPSSTAVTLTGTQTLTNKTLTAPVISTISNTGTLTLPTSTDTLVGKATTDTLTNKTLTSPALTTPTISTATTNGDILYGTGSGALARLGIGSSGQSLVVASGIPSWATASSGGMTLLSTTTLSGSTTTISSISGAYNQLCIQVFDAYGSAAGGTFGRFNGDATSAAYQEYFAEPSAGTVYPSATPWYYSTATSYSYTTGSLRAADTNFFMQILLPNYADTTSRKMVSVFAAFENAGSQNSVNVNEGFWNNTAAITSITFVAPGGGTWTQGTVRIWGII